MSLFVQYFRQHEYLEIDQIANVKKKNRSRFLYIKKNFINKYISPMQTILSIFVCKARMKLLHANFYSISIDFTKQNCNHFLIINL